MKYLGNSNQPLICLQREPRYINVSGERNSTNIKHYILFQYQGKWLRKDNYLLVNEKVKHIFHDFMSGIFNNFKHLYIYRD